MSAPTSIPAFTGFVDLASERVGGRALYANDEFFAGKENLLRPGDATFDPDRYTEFGKWMDGWESRRKRVAGHDWCVIRLGLPGAIHGLDIDTSFFLGNHPPYASVEACVLGDDGYGVAAGPPALSSALERATWTEILPRSPLAPGAHNLFGIASRERWTHLRLNIFPDGGVARLRAYGRVMPDWSRVDASTPVDLACVANGGLVLAASDMFFGSKENLILPGRSESMRDGWETRRRRGPGHDWCIVKFGRAGRLRRLEVDTSHFKGNFPDRCSITACHSPDADPDALTWTQFGWKELLPETKLAAHTVHAFERELLDVGPCTHLMLNVHPDGGVARLRAIGTIG
jgi:allantoicase